MSQRNAIVIRFAALGFGAGFLLACLMVIRANPLPPASTLVGQILGCIIGTTVIAIVLGVLRAKSIPADTPAVAPLSRARLAVLAVCLFVIVAAIAGTAVMMASSGHSAARLTTGLAQPITAFPALMSSPA